MSVTGGTEDDPLRIVRYQYRHIFYVAEYFRGNTRLALAIADGRGASRLQLKLKLLNSRFKDLYCDSNVRSTPHGNFTSGVCGGAHADNYTYTAGVFTPADRNKDRDHFCDIDTLTAKTFPGLRRCPKLSIRKVGAVVISNSWEGADDGVSALLDDFDFGSDWQWGLNRNEC